LVGECNSMKLLTFLFLYLTIFIPPLYSQNVGNLDYAVFDSILELEFEPHEAFFLVDFGGRDVRKFPATIMPVVTTLGSEDEELAREPWAFGALTIVPAGKRSALYSLVVSGEGGQLFFQPPVRKNLIQEKVIEDSHPELERLKIQGMEELRSLSVERRGREAELQRLEKDAAVIGSFSQVIELREELSTLKNKLENARKDILNLETFLKIIDAEATPPGFQRRENDLSRQLRELASAAREAENNEVYRKEARQENRHERQQVASQLDADSLQIELGNLRRQRIQLERATSNEPVESTDYFDMGGY